MKTILVVDDEADMRRVVRLILEPLGRIIEASNGQDALRLVAEEKPGLMVLDVMMAGMDGLAVVRAARLLDADLPIVMLSGASDMETAKRALDDGARAYITKPFDADGLLGEVRRLLYGADGARAAANGRPWDVRK